MRPCGRDGRAHALHPLWTRQVAWQHAPKAVGGLLPSRRSCCSEQGEGMRHAGQRNGRQHGRQAARKAGSRQGVQRGLSVLKARLEWTVGCGGVEVWRCCSRRRRPRPSAYRCLDGAPKFSSAPHKQSLAYPAARYARRALRFPAHVATGRPEQMRAKNLAKALLPTRPHSRHRAPEGGVHPTSPRCKRCVRVWRCE
jgi:hypothetical protein